jgi:hypothetical protein
VHSAKRTQIGTHVSLGRADNDTPLRDGQITADESLSHSECCVFWGVSGHVEHLDPTGGRDGFSGADCPIRRDSSRGLERSSSAVSGPYRQIELAGVLGNCADVIGVVVCDGDVFDITGDGGINIVASGRWIDEQSILAGFDVAIRLAGRCACVDRQ